MDLNRSVSCLVGLCLVSGFFPPLLCLAEHSAQTSTSPPQFRGMTIHRSGGFAGVEDEWDFSEKGVRRMASGASVQTSPGKLQRLRQLVALKVQRELTSLPAISLCSDCFAYRITVWYDGFHHTFEVTEAGGRGDGEVIELLGLVRELTSDHPPKP